MESKMINIVSSNFKDYIKELYNKYKMECNECHSYDIFYSFLELNKQDISHILKTCGYEKVFLYNDEIYFKKNDDANFKFKMSFLSFCDIYGIYTVEHMYINTGDNSYFTPFICGYNDITQEIYDDFMDKHCETPRPSFIIETVDISDNRHYSIMKEIFSFIKQNNNDSIILFVDVRNKKLFEMVICKNGVTDTKELKFNDDLNINGVIFNFGNICI
ncbi:hypothetical protein TCON_0973 [Astathelohania contejeani]|uniref:Uncharacterized protein n=1 Tax=Astathelohania contejeani TaxID=164912 RepID=A0ABQ7I072_9MICR|nr:hypothetical protein TCON_0973 [Thelohania contejeani]